jgi:hypothetical protein
VHELIAQATGNAQVIRMFKQVNDLVVLFGISLLRLQPERASAILSENGRSSPPSRSAAPTTRPG